MLETSSLERLAKLPGLVLSVIFVVSNLVDMGVKVIGRMCNMCDGIDTLP